MPSINSNYSKSGPILDVWIGVSEPRRRLLASHSLQPNPSLKLSLIIDTGADTTMISEQHMRSLGIPVRGTAAILTSTTDEKAAECNTYDVSLKLTTFGEAPFLIPAVEIIGRPLFNHSIDGMIGRDVLSQLVFTMDGPRRRFRIDF